jgi:hypothetical protein
MWGFVLGAIGIGLALYELATRNSAVIDPAVKAYADPNARRAAQARQDAVAARAIKCGLLATDLRDAEAWSRGILGSSLGVLERLKLLLSAVPWVNWPYSARRVYCTYIADVDVQAPIGTSTRWGLPPAGL